MSRRIEDYALIGDLCTAALVHRDGSIDWLCWPRFDSDACFTALLGTPDNGRWRVSACDETATVTRAYRDDTLVLETRIETADGEVVVIDCMPPRDDSSHLDRLSHGSHLVRIVRGVRGTVTMRSEFVLRFGYGLTVPWVTRIDDMTLRAIAGPDMVTLRSPVSHHGENFRSVSDFTVRAGEDVPFVLSYAPSHWPLPDAINPVSALERTVAFWENWSGRARIDKGWRKPVIRSLITLKALTFLPTGGLVAAPTTSLPERLGGPRNWDYRYCWLRDATLTLLALMNAGYYDEADQWREWLLRAAAGSPDQIQIMYGIGGERRLTEWEVPWLEGFAQSRPVRIGNAAHEQRQLDIYGEVMDALHQAREGGLGGPQAGWAIQCAFLDHLETIWQEPDEGIWEVRSAPEHFVYSKAMAWVAFDRAIRSAENHNLEAPLAHWRRVRRRIHDDVCARGFDTSLNSFVRAYGTQELDASLLLLPAIGFLPPEDPRIRGTIDAIERKLMVNGFVRRYDTHESGDGLPGGEGVFLACSFWLADAYAMIGRRDDAVHLFERLLSICNDVGLLAEQFEPAIGTMVGNFPQAFSHLALVNTASNLSHTVKPAEQRGQMRMREPAPMRGQPY